MRVLNVERAIGRTDNFLNSFTFSFTREQPFLGVYGWTNNNVISEIGVLKLNTGECEEVANTAEFDSEEGFISFDSFDVTGDPS